MRIGYPCINRGIGCSANRTFRLSSYTEKRLIATVAENIACLNTILEWNAGQEILFFRITSDLVPFASHPVCTYSWQEHFHDELSATGDLIRKSGIRISMHPDQFIILNTPDDGVLSRSTAELAYHARVLDLIELDDTAKIQIHIGGVYGNREESIRRFIQAFDALDPEVSRRLVVENDDSRFSAADCLGIHEETGIPVLFDVFHHSCNNSGETLKGMLLAAGRTWKQSDGIPMVDYSAQHLQKRKGSHAEHIDIDDFRSFLELSAPLDMDIMLEIKDKERSALAAVAAARNDMRFCHSSRSRGQSR